MKRILYVEDNEDNIFMLTRRLEKLGYALEVARDGREALEKALGDPPDLILMDLGLPIIDGWTATRRLKEDPRTAGTPIIALTAHAMPGELQRARDAGCDDIDTKPVSLKRLRAKIEALIGVGAAA